MPSARTLQFATVFSAGSMPKKRLKLFATKSLREQESALVTKFNGRSSVKHGPTRIVTFFKKVERLPLCV